MPAKKPRAVPEEPKVITFETFRGLGVWERAQISQGEPSCFNGCVRVHKTRVTFERIDEPDDVIYERLLKLWREADNHHHWVPLEIAAKRIGRELPRDEWGVARKKP